MELAITNDENSLDPTPNLKSSPIPILFVSFKWFDRNCFNCGDEYTLTCFFDQKYCKKCLVQYITDIADNKTYLDMCTSTMNIECNEHEMRDKELLIQNIQEWCENYSQVSYFKQIFARSYNYNSYEYYTFQSKAFESEKDCKLCGKLVYQHNYSHLNFKVCSNCYLISSGQIESTLTKKDIPILYLPWWDNNSHCIVACYSKLKFTSDCQKYCTKCCVIYAGCRYCLTTNIIFGFIDKSQCKKCKRILIIIDTNISNSFLYNFMFNYNNYNLQLAEIIDDVKKTDDHMDIYRFTSREKYKTRNTNSTNPMLRSSSPTPILFVPFNQEDQNCFYCGDEYIQAPYNQKHCKKCLLHYFDTTADINTYLDTNVCKREMNNKISSEQVESTLTKKQIPSLYLPWWDNKYRCIACGSNLKFPSDCQKYCSNCFIVYTGCRYCLTTNIIFGFTAQSQCKKCKRFITIDEDVKNDFFYYSMFNLNSNYNLQLDEIIDDIKKTNNNPMDVYKFIHKNYEICNSKPTNTTLKLKSSSVMPILFVPFKQNNWKCFHCGDEYVQTNYDQKKYCKKCLSCYITNITDITDINAFIDANVCEHEVGSVKCLDCFQISSEWVKSTLIKKQILILYLSWWDKNNNCIACGLDLKFTSDCQKYCTHCHIIYAGCRYCLTTNIIFGFTDQSQCMKCKRTNYIKSISGNSNLDDFLYEQRLKVYNSLQLDEIIFKQFDTLMKIYSFINEKYKDIQFEPMMEWIPYCQITNMKEITRGGFGIIYQATWLDGSLNEDGFRESHQTVIVKRFENSRDISKYFLNELKSNQCCFKFKCHIIRSYGFTKDPESNEVMQCASEGDLHNYLQKKFTEITWNKDKLRILYQISDGLKTIHDANFIHRDFHSGNILLDLQSEKKHQWQIGDLGLSQHANDTSSNNEIYGVIPYIAPEIFKGSAFSKESDVYSFGMFMWELTTGCKPFANVEHDHILIYQILNGKQPEITNDTQKCFANLMRSCWNPDPSKRPPIMEIHQTFYRWFYRNENNNQFKKAEIKRKKLLDSKKLGPEFTEKLHSKAIYISRPLRSLISESSSINSISFDSSQDYISNEYELDIDFQSSSLQHLNPIIHNSLINQHPGAIYTSRPISAFITAATSSRKRDIEELDIETYDNNSGKYAKTIQN